MRVALVSESFLPQVNGVTNTVRHVVDRLLATGHEPLVVAPGPGPDRYRAAPVVRVRSLALPGYRSFPLGLPDAVVERTLEEFAPDVVHLASPIALGAVGLRAARRLDIPTVAVYQTDIAGFARQYGIRADAAVGRWVGRIHRRADRTLVPSTASHHQLARLGVTDLHLWRRGVSLDLFAPGRRDPALHDRWTRGCPDCVVVGYVGRLAPEKQVRRLVELASVPGVCLVVVGDGPARDWLERRLPGATFTGMLRDKELARAFASLDVFVHPGEAETFCQTVQEAQASGVPVVAPAAGGPLDLVDDGRSGVLYDPAAPGALRRAVGELVRDPGLRADLAGEALTTVAARSWAAVVDELVGAHYAAVAGTGRPSGLAA
jgi:phosphatidylinositol alpha 1,6-mannosyltransferase